MMKFQQTCDVTEALCLSSCSCSLQVLPFTLIELQKCCIHNKHKLFFVSYNSNLYCP